jgi:hypothetical protein
MKIHASKQLAGNNLVRLIPIKYFNVFKLSQKVEMEPFHTEYSTVMMAQLWLAIRLMPTTQEYKEIMIHAAAIAWPNVRGSWCARNLRTTRGLDWQFQIRERPGPVSPVRVLPTLPRLSEAPILTRQVNTTLDSINFV